MDFATGGEEVLVEFSSVWLDFKPYMDKAFAEIQRLKE